MKEKKKEEKINGKKSESERKQRRNENERGQMESKRGKGNESEKTKSTQAKCIVGVKRIRECGQVKAKGRGIIDMKDSLQEGKKKDLLEGTGRRSWKENDEGQQEENKIEEWKEEDWMKEEPVEETWSRDQEEESGIGIERYYRVHNGKVRARYVRVGKEMATGVLEGEAWREKWKRKQENPSPALDWIESDQEEDHWIEELEEQDEEHWIKDVEEEKEELEAAEDSLNEESRGTVSVKMYAVDGWTGKGITSCKGSIKAQRRIGKTDEPVQRVNELLSSLVITDRKAMNRSMNLGPQVSKNIQVSEFYENSIVIFSFSACLGAIL